MEGLLHGIGLVYIINTSTMERFYMTLKRPYSGIAKQRSGGHVGVMYQTKALEIELHFYVNFSFSWHEICVAAGHVSENAL